MERAIKLLTDKLTQLETIEPDQFEEFKADFFNRHQKLIPFVLNLTDFERVDKPLLRAIFQSILQQLFVRNWYESL